MQIGGIGSSHSTSDHHVTNCIHDHHEAQKDPGAMAMKTAASMEASAAKAELQQEGQFSLAAWLKNTLGNSRGFLLNFWGDGQAASEGVKGDRTAVSGAEGSQAAVSQTAAQAGDSGVAAAMSAQLAVQQQVTQGNPGFSAAGGRESQKQPLWKKIRARLHNASGQLNGRRLQKFFGFQTKNSFHTKREQSREDLRKNNRYRRDTVEINFARTDDNYLMDSYDRKGEYSRLTTKK